MKHKTLIIVALALILIFVALPSLVRQFNVADTSRTIEAIAKRYGVTDHYVLGSANECVDRAPTSFGEVTGLRVCYRITAVAYYPQVKLSDYTQQPEGLTMIDYVYLDKKGSKSTEHVSSLYTGSYEGRYSDFGQQLNLSMADHVTVSGISGRYDKSSQNRIAGVWRWDSSLDWLGQDGAGSDLKTRIDAKILADESPGKNAPAPTETLKTDHGPLIAYVVDRYCHSPNIIGLDHVCVLPN